jgi:hypothetical protein
LFDILSWKRLVVFHKDVICCAFAYMLMVETIGCVFGVIRHGAVTAAPVNGASGVSYSSIVLAPGKGVSDICFVAIASFYDASDSKAAVITPVNGVSIISVSTILCV